MEEAPIYQAHYKGHPSGLQPWDICELLGFNLGNALKYVLRYDKKGKPIEDLEKAVTYLQRELNFSAGDSTVPATFMQKVHTRPFFVFKAKRYQEHEVPKNDILIDVYRSEFKRRVLQFLIEMSDNGVHETCRHIIKEIIYQLNKEKKWQE